MLKWNDHAMLVPRPNKIRIFRWNHYCKVLKIII